MSEIAALDDVTEVHGTYQDNLTAPGTFDLGLVVRSETDREALRDEVYRIVWRSEVEPLDRISLRIGADGDYTDFSIPLSADRVEEFERRFGER